MDELGCIFDCGQSAAQRHIAKIPEMESKLKTNAPDR